MRPIPYSWSGGQSANFDAAAAAQYVGKYILIAVAYLDAEGKQEDSVQMHGVIKTASADGITVALKGERDGKTWTMPADPTAISSAAPGRYKLPETDEIVENPDFITTWAVQKPRAS